MISVVHTFKLYELVNKYFRNDEDSKTFVSEIDQFMTFRMTSDNELATKTDIQKLESGLGRLEVKMGGGFKDILKWIIALMLGFLSLMFTIMKFLS